MPTLTLLFTDIAGSTRLWETHPEAMREALEVHDRLIREGVEKRGGHVFKHTGDGAIAAFPSAGEGLRAAADIQRRMADTVHPDIGVLELRMAIHTGEVEEREGDYFGPPLNRAARLLSVANPGQVLVSLVTERLAGPLEEGMTVADLGEYRLRDLARSERVFQLEAEGLARDFPPLQTPDLVPNNLPTLATSFVGRSQELGEVIKLVRGARLVTVTGVGGAGKTRLALQAAAELADDFPDGIWLIELGAVTDPDLIDASTAGALGIAQEAGRSLRESIVEHLAGRQVLLIMDNCEHLIHAAAGLVDEVITHAPLAKVLATSRELLGVRGEVAFGLQSLGLPDRDDEPDPTILARYDGVRLFLERAEASSPDFRFSAQTAPAVLEICHRLDGMPLALELAAARLRSFTPRQIAENLDQRFRLLTGGSRTALPRQQTLAAAIDWSYRLLEDKERLLFERLSVFQGGFTFDAVEAVCTDEKVDALAVLELVPSLVDKSLVVVDTGGEEARYRLLETLRQFARDRLDDSGVADTFRARHARFFLDMAVEAGQHIRGPNEVAWWERIDTELDNLRQAMTWAIDAGEGELALSIAGAFWRFWWFKARWSEGVAWLRRAVEAAGPGVSKRVRAQGLLGYGSLLEPSESHVESERILREATRLYAELDEEGADPDDLRYGYPAALINLSVTVEAMGGDPKVLEELNRRALEVSRRIDDQPGIAVSLGNLAESMAEVGDGEEARALFAEAVEASKALGSTQRLVDLYQQLGFFELATGSRERARVAFEGSLDQADEGGLIDQAAIARAYIAVCDAELGLEGALERFSANAARAFQNPDLRVFALLRQRMLVLRAGLDAGGGRWEQAAKVLGAIAALEEAGTALNWELAPRRDRVLQEVRARLGDEAEAAIAEGRRLDPTAVIELIIAFAPDPA